MDNLMLLQLLAAYLFAMGLLLIILRRNTIVILMGIELLLNAANLSLVSFSNHYGLIEGQLQVLFVITIAAAESAVGLSILINLYRNFGSIRTDRAQELRG